jgi:hypothetical protein
VIPSKFGYVRGYTRTWHLIDAPLTTIQPWRDPQPQGAPGGAAA